MVVFKDDLVHDCVDLSLADRVVLSVITVAAPRKPELTSDGSRLARTSDLEDFRAKIRLVYRMAASEGRDSMILGAVIVTLPPPVLELTGQIKRSYGMWYLRLSTCSGSTGDEVDVARG